MGALAGYLASVLPSAHTSTGRVLHAEKDHYIDMMVTADDQKVIVELKRGDSRSLMDRGMAQLSIYLAAANARDGVLFLYSEKSTNYDVITVEDNLANSKIRVLRPVAQPSIAL